MSKLTKFTIYVTSDKKLYTQKSGDILRPSTVTEMMEVIADIGAEVWDDEGEGEEWEQTIT